LPIPTLLSKRSENMPCWMGRLWLWRRSLRHGYVVIDPKDVKGSEKFVSTIRGVFRHGRTVDLQQISKPDLIVEGSVAVNQQDIGLEKDMDTAAQKYGL
jgi:hypothetical protein